MPALYSQLIKIDVNVIVAMIYLFNVLLDKGLEVFVLNLLHFLVNGLVDGFLLLLLD